MRDTTPGFRSFQLGLVNGVSAGRLVLAPVFAFLLASKEPFLARASALVLVFLLASDIVDGWLARRWHVTTDVGYVLDGVADRASHFGIVIPLCSLGMIATVMAFLLLFRDVLLYGARSLFPGWWAANPYYRGQVRLLAVAYKIVLAPPLLLVYDRAFGWHAVAHGDGATLLRIAAVAQWAFVIAAYWLLYRQIRSYTRSAR